MSFNLTVRAFLILTIIFAGCKSSATQTNFTPNPRLAVVARNPALNVFDDFLKSEIPISDGFDFPIGDANAKGSYTDQATGKTHNDWYIATKFGEQYALGIHPAEDWNGRGGGNTDYGQDVFAVANGRVKFAQNYGQPWGNVVVIEHIFYENHEKQKILSLYAHLSELKVKAGQEVKRRQVIAAIGQDPNKTFAAHLHLELRWDESLTPSYWPSSNGKDLAWIKERYAHPSNFINSHRKLFIPQNEVKLIVVDHASYKMRLYKSGKMQGEYDVSFGQEKGQKKIQGDNKTPKGMYFIIQKHRGKFDGAYGEYYGGHWIKVNYPNRYDAARGRSEGIVSASQEATINSRWMNKQATMENTKLGGGIGFHGWIKEWNNDGPRHLSWGCVVMHIFDISKIFDEMNEGAMVVIL